MKKAVALVAVLVATLGVVAGADARPNAHLEREVRALRHQLHNAILARNAARDSLAQTQGTDAALRSQVAQLTNERNAALAQVSSLQGQAASLETQVGSLRKQLASIPTPFAVALEQVRREVAWAQHYGSAYSYGRLVAQAALDYVSGHVSASAYGYLLFDGDPLPGPAGNPTPDSILGLQAGICGHDSIVFAAIVKRFGLPVRSVQFYETNGGNHIGVEVYYDGGWHYFDPLYDLAWTDAGGDVLSMADARAPGADPIPLRNALVFANFALGYDVGFELDPATTVVYGGQAFHY